MNKTITIERLPNESSHSSFSFTTSGQPPPSTPYRTLPVPPCGREGEELPVVNLKKVESDWIETTESVIRQQHNEKLMAKRKIAEEKLTSCGRRELMKTRIAEEEAIGRQWRERLQTKKIELQRAEEEKNAEIEKMKAKRVELEKSTANYKELLEGQVEYSSSVGRSLVTFQVDYKSDPGNVLCPEKKVCASSKGSPIECDYWNCPLIKSKIGENKVE